MPLIPDPNLIVGMERLDDAAVYRLTEEIAIIQTIDFITPIVDDPYTFGQIAAANSLSDVYAMGGKPLTAMNVVCFPIKKLGTPLLKDILRGGLERMQEAGVTLVGGHSVEDAEMKYGLSVTGIIHPKRVVTKAGARPGDRLILTKPLGTGVISTALKGGVASAEAVAAATRGMVALNKKASELMQAVGVHACTDITGFGFLGHICEVAQASGVGMEIDTAAIPFYPGAEEYAQMSLFPAGAFRNRDFRASMVEVGGLPDYKRNLLFDPQTSGGLFISAPAAKAEELLAQLHRAGIAEAALVGEVVELPEPKVLLR